MPGFLADVLSRPHNQGLRLSVEASKSWGVPPRQVILAEPMVWGVEDTLLSMAMTLLKQETCKECGTVSWHGHSTDNRITFEMESATCFGCMEQEGRREDKNNPIDKGEKPYVVAKMYDDSELPSRSEEYERRASRR